VRWGRGHLADFTARPFLLSLGVEPENQAVQQAFPDDNRGRVLRMTLREVFETFYKPDLVEEGRLSTAEAYETSLRAWERFTSNPAVGDIDAALLDAFRRASLAGRSPQTVERDRRSIRAILRRIGPQHDRNPRGLGHLTQIPYMRPSRADLGFPRIVTFEELDALYAAFGQATYPLSCVPAPEFWRTLIVLAYNVGARRHDLLTLRTSDVDFGRREIRFRARKTSRAQVVPINATVIAHLRAIWSDRAALFPNWHTAAKASASSRFRIRFNELQDLAGVRRLGLQTLRKTCASAYADLAGSDVAAYVLGHHTPGVSRQFYINPTRRVIEAVNSLPQPESFRTPKRCCVAQVTRRSDWRFGSGRAVYRGFEIRLPGRPLAALQALVAAGGRPISFAELRDAAFFGPRPAESTVKRAVHRLRSALSKAFGLPRVCDPIPWDRFGGGRGWILALPPDVLEPRGPQLFGAESWHEYE
jgi:integrase